MLEIIKYSFLRLLRNKTELFWILLFPILLSTLFKVGFSGINSTETFKSIPVAVVSENENGLEVFKIVEKSLNSDNNSMLKVKYTDKSEAKNLLKKQKIHGIITISDKLNLTVSANMTKESVNQSILSSFVKQYNVSQDAIKEISLKHPEKLSSIVSSMKGNSVENKKVTLTDRENSDSFTQYFYNLLAMACLLTASSGLLIAINNQGNLSVLGARRCISPTHKLKSILGELFTFIVFNFICNLISYIYITAVLKVDLTSHLPLEILTLFLATLTGISLGFFVGSIGNGSQTLKESISISTIMALCFLSGLMVANMKMIVNNFCPVLNKINPAVLISDAFYSLSVYNTYDRYMKDIISLCILIVIFITGGFLFTRRKKYASL